MKNYRANVQMESALTIKVNSLIDESNKEVELDKVLGIAGNVVFYSVSNGLGGLSHFKIDSGCFYTNYEETKFLVTKFHEKAERVW